MLNDIKVSSQLAILLSFMLMGLVVAGAEGLFGTDELNSAMKSSYENRVTPIVQLNAIHIANLANRLAISNAVYHPDDIAKYIQEIEKNKSVIDRQWEIYTATVLHNAPDDEGKYLIAKFDEIRGRFVKEGIDPALVAMRANNLAEIKRIQIERIDPLNAPLNESLNALTDKQIRDAKKVHEAFVWGFGSS